MARDSSRRKRWIEVKAEKKRKKKNRKDHQMIDSNDKNVREGETRMLLIKRQEEKQKHNLLTEQVLEQLFFFLFLFSFSTAY